MVEILQLKNTPVPDLLVLAGIVFIFVAVVGSFPQIVIPRHRQLLAAFIGFIFLGFGVSLYLTPDNAGSVGSSAGLNTSSPSSESTLTSIASLITDTPFVVNTVTLSQTLSTGTPTTAHIPTRTDIPSLTPIPTVTDLPGDRLILYENFSDFQADGWITLYEPDFEVIQLDDGNIVWSSHDGFKIYNKPDGLDNFAFETKVMHSSGNRGEHHWGAAFLSIGITPSEGDCLNMYHYYMDTGGNWLNLVDTDGKTCSELRENHPFANRRIEMELGEWYVMRVEVIGSTIRAYLDGMLMMSLDFNPIRKSNTVGLWVCCEDSSPQFYFDDIRIWSLNE